MEKSLDTPKSTTGARSGSIIMLPISEGACSKEKNILIRLLFIKILVVSGIGIYAWHAHIF